ncbi:MAG: cation:proton antiporter [Elusimicrobiota bacterium]
MDNKQSVIPRADTAFGTCFGAIATATAPAAVVMVVREYKAKGKFTNTLLGVVAFDDGLELMFFAIILAVARSMVGVKGSVISHVFTGVMHGLVEIAGAVIVGVVFGWLLSVLSKYVKSSSELLIYILGFILLNAGLSLFLGVSLLLSNMTMAGVLVNIDKTCFRFFDSIGSIDSPLYLLFFVLAGANLELNLLGSIGMVGIIYILARMLGKVLGSYISARLISAPGNVCKYLGIALAPQAGVALGMAMVLKNVFPNEGSYIVSTIIATTVVYEILGPPMTKYALKAARNIEI